MSRPKVFIPFRPRQADGLLRSANLEIVQAWWWMWGCEPVVVSDDLEDDAPFNRHRAFNLAVAAHPDEEVYVFSEADMLIPPDQVVAAVTKALRLNGIVVPFRQHRSLTPETTASIRDGYYEYPISETVEWWALDCRDPRSIFQMRPENLLSDGEVVGSIFAVSRNTIDLVGGFCEATSGVLYDDWITADSYAYLTDVPTRYVRGSAAHLYHPALWRPTNPDERDVEAMRENYRLWRAVSEMIEEGDREGLSQTMHYRLDKEI